MPPLNIQIINPELNRPFIIYKIHFHFPMRMSLNIFSSIASNKQRQEHMQYLSLNVWSNTQGNSWVLQEPHGWKQNNLNANPNKNEQGSHWGLLAYGDNGWKLGLDETNTYSVNCYVNPRTPFCTSTFTSTFLTTTVSNLRTRAT